MVPVWRKEVEAWEMDRRNPNPYAAKVKSKFPISLHRGRQLSIIPVVSERDVRLELARDAARTLSSEREAEKQGAAPASAVEVHSSTVIAMGLELEELQ